jgi:hypothetical protein
MSVSLVPDVRMNVEEFLAWSQRQPEPEDQRYDPPGLSVSVIAFLGEEDY